MADDAPRIDRETADAVLRRALERAQTGVGAHPAGLTPDQLVAVGRELGASEADVRAALGDVLGGGTAAARPGGLLGPRGAVGRRTVEADAETATARVAGWLEAGECLRLVRSTPDGTTTWEPRGGLLGPLRGAERQLLGEPAELRRARRTIARVRALDADTSVVELEVELSRERPLVGLGVGGIAGALAVGAALLGPLYLLLLVPLLVLGGLVIGVLAQRAEARRLSTAVERRLDAVARALPPPTSTLDVGATARGLARSAARALRSPRR